VHNVRVPPLTPRTAAVLLALGLAATACSGGGTSGGDAPPSPSASSSPSTTVDVPAGVSLTAEGSRLKFGGRAGVVFEPTQKRSSVLDLTVRSAKQGSVHDFKDYILDDPYKKKASYYYVKVQVKNVGKGDVGGVPVPLWGVNGDNVLLPAVNFTTSFKKCPSKQLPHSFGPGDTFSTCLVYLSPDHGQLRSVSYRPDQTFNPITWTGQVAAPASAKPAKPSKSAKH